MFRYASIGIVSFGVGCAKEGFPGAYTRMSCFLGFVADQFNLKAEFTPPNENPFWSTDCPVKASYRRTSVRPRPRKNKNKIKHKNKDKKNGKGKLDEEVIAIVYGQPEDTVKDSQPPKENTNKEKLDKIKLKPPRINTRRKKKKENGVKAITSEPLTAKDKLENDEIVSSKENVDPVFSSEDLVTIDDFEKPSDSKITTKSEKQKRNKQRRRQQNKRKKEKRQKGQRRNDKM